MFGYFCLTAQAGNSIHLSDMQSNDFSEIGECNKNRGDDQFYMITQDRQLK
jgi:hypothetical protein